MMDLKGPFAAALLAFAMAVSAVGGDWTSESDWPQFRGRRAAGVADGQDPPISWDVESGSNVAWKTPIPGLGHASPIVVGDRVFVVTANSGERNPSLRIGLYGDIAPVQDEGEQSWDLYCLSKRSGTIRWKRAMYRGAPQIKRHTKASHANSTPATDGMHLVVFLGSEGLYCYDLCGNLKWKRNLGLLDSGYYVVPSAQWGFGSSPIIYRNMVIVQCDVQKNSFIAAFNIDSGCELWRTERQDVPTWSTPAIYEGANRAELIVNGYKHAGGYDPWTGNELWRLSDGGDIPVPTPVFADDSIILSSAHGAKRPLCAVRAGARGDITLKGGATSSEYIAWYEPREGIYMQTPIVYRGLLYACRNNGVLSCYDVGTGKRLYRARLGSGGFTASAVAADGRIYFTSENGLVYVVQAGPKFKVLAENKVGEVCMATPAISDGLFIVRAKRHVYGIGVAKRDNTTVAARSHKRSSRLRRTRFRFRRGR